MADLDGDIRAAAASYLLGRTTIEAFEEWFVPRAWDERTDLVVAIDHLLAEREVLDQEQFDNELRVLVSTVHVPTAMFPKGASSATTLHAPRRVLVGGE